jgi:hypothetical protein
VPVSQQGGGEQSKPAPEAKTDAPTEQKTDAPAEQKTEQTEEPKKEETEGEHTDDQTGRQLEEQQRKELDEIPRQANEARSKPNQTLRTWLRAVLERYIAERKEDKDFSDGQANALRARLEEVLAMSTFALLREIGLAETFNRMFTYYRDLVDAYDRGIEFHTESEAITGSESTERQEFEAAREQAQRTLDALTEFATDEGEGAAAEAEAGEGQTTAANPPPARRPQRAGTVGNKKLDHAQAFFGAKPKMSHLDSTQAIGWDFHTLKSIFYREAMRLALPPEWSVSGYESNGPITIEVPTIEQFMRLIDAMMNGTTQSELELLLERFSPREEGD